LRSGVPVFAFEFPCCLLLVVGRLSGSLKEMRSDDLPCLDPACRGGRGSDNWVLTPTNALVMIPFSVELEGEDAAFGSPQSIAHIARRMGQ
ncbi:MAG: hypothetical protein MUF54_03415, partial [Polyangiaceae bacterium]|nr:hypothetical protein [Polyangiaceae bacterium]